MIENIMETILFGLMIAFVLSLIGYVIWNVLWGDKK